MELSRDKLRDQLKRREIAPVYTLYGAETYLRDAAARYMTDISFADGELREFNESEFSLNDPNAIVTAIAAAEQLPMMASRRVVRINEVRVAATANRDTLKEEHADLVADYLARPSESSVLIFVADELNANRKLGKLLKQKTAAVDFRPLEDHELRKWIAERARELGSDAGPDAVSRLADLVGSDLRRLSNEIAKLSAAALPEKVISRELVDDLVANSRLISNFGLTDSLVAGRTAESIATLKKVLDDGVEPLALLGLIASNYRRLMIAHEMLTRGEAPSAVTREVRAFGPGTDAFMRAARRIETGKLTSALGRIAETDLAIKTSVGGGGPAGARLQLEMLVCELALL